MVKNILILEDEKALQQLYEDILQHYSPHSLNFMNTVHGDQALNLIQNPTPIDLLVSDIMHPGLSVFDMIRILKADYPSIKILILSFH